jgi:hypothetical protein
VTHYDQGTISVLRDSAEGIQELPGAEVHAMNVPTIVRGILFLPPPTFTLHSSLFSLSGRKVLDLKPGPNDVSRLAPGVYFVRSERSAVSREPSAFTKVVISS